MHTISGPSLYCSQFIEHILFALQHATQGLVIGEELKYFVVSMFGTVGKRKKKKVRLQSIIILSLQYPEKLYDYDPVQIGNAHLKRPEWTSTQEATTLWTCSNRRVLERETKPFGSEWSWCVEKLCINASDTQWRLRKKGNGHWLSLSKVSRPEPSLPERWKAIMVCSQQSQEPSVRLMVLYNHISADMFD